MVRATEAYAYHFKLVNKSPELYQPETLKKIRNGAEITTRAYIQGRRDLAQARRIFERAFESVDVLVTPTITAPPPTTAEMNKDLETSIRLGGIFMRNIAPFNVWGNPADIYPVRLYTQGPADRPSDQRPQRRRGDSAATGTRVRASHRLAYARARGETRRPLEPESSFGAWPGVAGWITR